jgi:hypothetical protein
VAVGARDPRAGVDIAAEESGRPVVKGGVTETALVFRSRGGRGQERQAKEEKWQGSEKCFHSTHPKIVKAIM